MARERGLLVSGSAIVTAKGEHVSTFMGCDEEFLGGDGIVPGDIVTFSRVRGSKDAEAIRKATPTAKEQQTFEAQIAEIRAPKKRERAPGVPKGQKDEVGRVVRALVELGFIEALGDKALRQLIASVLEGPADEPLGTRVLEQCEAEATALRKAGIVVS